MSERKRLAGRQGDLSGGKRADSQLGSLQVGENADRPAAALLDGANPLDQQAHRVMAGMTHIDAEEIGPGLEQLLDHVLFGRCRPQRGKNLYFAVALHTQFWPSCVLGASESCTIQLPCARKSVV